MSVTFRVYDAALTNKKFEHVPDRFSLYVPYPRDKRKEYGNLYGIYLGFSFNEKFIIKCCWDECKYGVKYYNLGRKISRETLPLHVQKWVSKLEKTYNDYLKCSSAENWEKWLNA